MDTSPFEFDDGGVVDYPQRHSLILTGIGVQRFCRLVLLLANPCWQKPSDYTLSELYLCLADRFVLNKLDGVAYFITDPISTSFTTLYLFLFILHVT